MVGTTPFSGDGSDRRVKFPITDKSESGLSVFTILVFRLLSVHVLTPRVCDK